MTKQEMREKMRKMDRVLDTLPDDVDILHFQGCYDGKYDYIHLYKGEIISNFGDKIPYGEYDSGTKCIKHSSIFDGVDVFFLEEGQNGG